MRKQAKRKSEVEQMEQANRLWQAVLGSSHQIRLAGLGAFAETSQEGRKTFQALVEQGKLVEQRIKAAIDNAERIKALGAQVPTKVNARWDKLELVFEDRVARALNRLGVSTAADVEKLAAHVKELSAMVNELMLLGGKQTKPAAKKKGTRSRGVASGRLPSPPIFTGEKNIREK